MNTFGDTPLARILSPGVFNFDASERGVRCPSVRRDFVRPGRQLLAHLTAADLCDTFNRQSCRVVHALPCES